ncbi:hypothetical protein JHK85_025961 [Glycine max]|nr:hypothetical protein JHK85_025961 [Glycine max]KAG5013191.1 hypothetical protein JHK86_025452 [Glycine max]
MAKKRGFSLRERLRLWISSLESFETRAPWAFPRGPSRAEPDLRAKRELHSERDFMWGLEDNFIDNKDKWGRDLAS